MNRLQSMSIQRVSTEFKQMEYVSQEVDSTSSKTEKERKDRLKK